MSRFAGFPGRDFPHPGNMIAALHKLGSELDSILALPGPGRSLYVDPVNGGNGSNDGLSKESAFSTLTYALTKCKAFDTIYLLPGQYDESAVIVVPRVDSLTGAALNNLRIIGLGGRGSAYIEPSTEDQSGLDVRADDVTLVNVGVAGEDETSAFALTVTGSRFRAYGCKFEGGLDQAIVGPGTAAQETAGTHGRGGDILFRDCEFAWGTNGLVIKSSDYGAATQVRVQDCWFHNLTGECLDENDAGAVGAGRQINVQNCVFENAEDGTAPSKYVDLDSAGTTGALINNVFVTTVHASAKIGLAAGVLYVGNFAQEEGPATGGGTSGRPD